MKVYWIFFLQPHPRPDMIDKKVIDGHIIPDRVVFTASAPLEEPFATSAFEDNIKVTVTFFTQGEGKHQRSIHILFLFILLSSFGFIYFINCLSIYYIFFLVYPVFPVTKSNSRLFFTAYVKSNTVVGDSKHSTGVVMAEIVRANIPVKNGVVHLIHRPLMIVDTTVIQFLEVRFIPVLFCILCRIKRFWRKKKKTKCKFIHPQIRKNNPLLVPLIKKKNKRTFSIHIEKYSPLCNRKINLSPDRKWIRIIHFPLFMIKKVLTPKTLFLFFTLFLKLHWNLNEIF